jgi:hypothetical protein
MEGRLNFFFSCAPHYSWTAPFFFLAKLIKNIKKIFGAILHVNAVLYRLMYELLHKFLKGQSSDIFVRFFYQDG